MNLDQANQILNLFSVDNATCSTDIESRQGSRYLQSASSSESTSTPLSSKDDKAPSSTTSSASSSASSVLRRFTDQPLQNISILTERTSSSSESSDNTPSTRKVTSFVFHDKNTSPASNQQGRVVKVQKALLKEVNLEDVHKRLAIAKTPAGKPKVCDTDLQTVQAVVQTEVSILAPSQPALSTLSEVLATIEEEVTSEQQRQRQQSIKTDEMQGKSASDGSTAESSSISSTVEIVDVAETIIEVITSGPDKPYSSSSSSELESISSLAPMPTTTISQKFKPSNCESPLLISKENILPQKEEKNTFVSKEYEKGECDKKYNDMENTIKALTERLKGLEITIEVLRSQQKPSIVPQIEHDNDEIVRLNEKRLLVLEGLQLEQTHLQRKLITLLEGFEERRTTEECRPPTPITDRPHVRSVHIVEPAEATPAPRSHVRAAPHAAFYRSEAAPCAELNISDNTPGNLLKHLIEAENSTSRDYGSPKACSLSKNMRPEVKVSPLNLLDKAKILGESAFGPLISSGDSGIFKESCTKTYELFNDVNRLENERCRVESNIDRMRFEAMVNEAREEPFGAFLFGDDKAAEARHRVRRVVGDIIQHHSSSFCNNLNQQPSGKQFTTGPSYPFQKTASFQPPQLYKRDVRSCEKSVATNVLRSRQYTRECTVRQKKTVQRVENVPLWRNKDYLTKIYGRDALSGPKIRPTLRTAVSSTRGRRTKSPGRSLPGRMGILSFLQNDNNNSSSYSECSDSDEGSFDVTSTTVTTESTTVEFVKTKKNKLPVVDDNDRLFIIKPAQVMPNRSVPRVTFEPARVQTIEGQHRPIIAQTEVSFSQTNVSAIAASRSMVEGPNFVNLPVVVQPPSTPLRDRSGPVHQSTPAEIVHPTRARSTEPDHRMTQLLEDELVQLIIRQNTNRVLHFKKPEIDEATVADTLVQMLVEVLGKRPSSNASQTTRPTTVHIQPNVSPTKDADQFSSENREEYESDTSPSQPQTTGFNVVSNPADSWDQPKHPTPRPQQNAVSQVSIAVATTPKLTEVPLPPPIALEDSATVTDHVEMKEIKQQTDQVPLVSIGIVTSPLVEMVPLLPATTTTTAAPVSTPSAPPLDLPHTSEEETQKQPSSKPSIRKLSAINISKSSSSPTPSSSSSSSHKQGNVSTSSTGTEEDHVTECSSLSAGQQLIDVSLGEIRLPDKKAVSYIENIFSDDEGDIDFLEKVIAGEQQQQQIVGDSEDVSFGENKVVPSSSSGELSKRDPAASQLDATISELERVDAAKPGNKTDDEENYGYDEDFNED